MPTGKPEGLKLTEEEAFALLGLCLTSPQGLDPISEKALRKLAEYCTSHSSIENPSITPQVFLRRGLDRAGA
jgi:hypothetical protein